jgi:hypothetical protein
MTDGIRLRLCLALTASRRSIRAYQPDVSTKTLRAIDQAIDLLVTERPAGPLDRVVVHVQ